MVLNQPQLVKFHLTLMLSKFFHKDITTQVQLPENVDHSHEELYKMSEMF